MTVRNDRSRAGIGLLMIVLGLAFFAAQVLGFQLGHVLWPMYVIVPGLAFFVIMAFGGKSLGGLAVPGSAITATGLILFYQNLTGHWESWAYAWGLIVAAVGFGITLGGSWSGDDEMRKSGPQVAVIGLVMFAVGFVFFELIVGISDFGGALRGFVAPAVLILLGILLVGRQFVGRARLPSGESEPESGEPAR